jgi:ankyrin repeat protein
MRTDSLFLEDITFLLEHGGDVRATGPRSRTLLQIAALRDYSDLVELLLHHGASLWARDDASETPLHLFYREPA